MRIAKKLWPRIMKNRKVRLRCEPSCLPWLRCWNGFVFALPKQKKYFQFSDGVWVIESLYFEVCTMLVLLELSKTNVEFLA